MTVLSRPTILVVDDDPLIAQSLRLSFQQEGYRVVVAASGAEALALAERESPDLVILDVGLPDLNGVEVCRRLRRVSAAPVLFLTARNDEIDKVVALDAGGDDYVTKPVGLAELSARVRAHLRRRGPESALLSQPRYEVGQLVLDARAHRVTLSGQEIAVTPREFTLLQALMEQPGQAMDRLSLLARVWGPDWYGDQNVLDVYIHHLRLKIEPDPARPRYIETVRGVGYRFAAR